MTELRALTSNPEKAALPPEVEVRVGYPEAAAAPIDLDDIAAFAATVLLEEGHVGKAYELSGPESISRAGMVRQIGQVLGCEIPYVELSHDEAVAQLTLSMGEFARWYVDAGWPSSPGTRRPRCRRSCGSPAGGHDVRPVGGGQSGGLALSGWVTACQPGGANGLRPGTSATRPIPP